VKRVFPEISELIIDYLDFYKGTKKNKLPPKSVIDVIDVKKCNFPVKTNRNCKYIIQMSFMDKNKEEKLRIHFFLKTKRSINRNNKKNGNTSKKRNGRTHHVKKNKSKLIEDLLEILEKNNLDLLEKCKLSELNKDDNFKNDIEELNKELKKNKITDIEKMKSMKDVIISINNIVIETKKINLLIKCFNIIHKHIINYKFFDENQIICCSYYKEFMENYNIGYEIKNDIVIMDNDRKKMNCEDIQDKMKTINENGQNNKRKHPIEEEISREEYNEKRFKKNITSRDDSKQTNKNSEGEVLLVDH
jgi:hypothetical protein